VTVTVFEGAVTPFASKVAVPQVTALPSNAKTCVVSLAREQVHRAAGGFEFSPYLVKV
jgi:hypothetical protein